jgi:hypothetical protein
VNDLPDSTYYKLLTAFENVFRGKVYRHRASNVGDGVAAYLYEDLFALGQAWKFTQRVNNHEVAVNTGNQIKGKKGRRGDGTFGRVVPGQVPARQTGFVVARGLVAHLEIGAEVKIGATKLIAQVDRVINDLTKQAGIFKKHNPHAIRVGIVGVNFADSYTGHEGDRQFVAKTPPSREAAEFVKRIGDAVSPYYDELLILRFCATNDPPYDFSWVSKAQTEQLYGSILVRVSAEYQHRF